MEARSYEGMLQYDSYGDRLRYLSLHDMNYNSPRYMSTTFFKSRVWKKVREEVIARDLGCDLGCMNMPIKDKIIVHHINPITEEDIETQSDLLLNPNNLITTSIDTHNSIHYVRRPSEPYVERQPNDTQLW